MAEYKYDTLAQQDVTWTSSKGDSLKVSVSLVQESSDYFGNGDYKPTRDGLRVSTKTYINGEEDSSCAWVKKLSKPQGNLVASIGKIGLTAERLAEVKAAEAEIEQHPAWQAKLAKEDAEDQADADYEQRRNAVKNMMTLNGKTF